MNRDTLRDNIQSFCQVYEISTREFIAALREEVATLPDDHPGDVPLAAQKLRRAERALNPNDEYPAETAEAEADEGQAGLAL